jgi:hypothetical protein
MIACDLFNASSTALLEEPMLDRNPTMDKPRYAKRAKMHAGQIYGI